MTSPLSTADRTQHAGIKRALHLTLVSLGWLLVGLFFVSGAMLLVARYAMMPRVDELRPRIEQIASRALKTPVTIGLIEASWRGFNPHLELSDVRIAGDRTSGNLSLPRVEATVSWLSVLAWEPRFSLLRMEAPEIEVARLPGDRFSVGGIIFDSKDTGEDSRASDWILAQGELVIVGATIRYRDRRSSVATTAFELAHVNLQLENLFGSHLFGMQAQPTAAIAGPLDLRARFRHAPFASASNTTRWSGEIFGELAYADLAALARLFEVPVKLERAHGAVRTWVTFARARVTRVIADVALTDVNVSLADELKPLVLASLQGRISQRRWGDDGGNGGQVLGAKQLTLVSSAQHQIAPLNIEVRTTNARGTVPARTQIQADRIDLRNLAWLSTHFPLARELREAVDRHAFEGTLTNVTVGWNGSEPDAKNLTLKTQFQHVASAAQPAPHHEIGLPGFQNLSGSVDLENGAGTLQLASRDTLLIVPGVFTESRIKLALFNASLQWKSEPVLELRVDSAKAANAEIEVEASGTYRAADLANPGERALGSIDLNGRVLRLDAPAAFRYVPIAVGNTAIEWLQHALIAGRVSDGALRIKGNLAHFPFGPGREGEMRISARVHDATLSVAPATRDDTPRLWPLLTGIDADVVFERASMTVTAQRGTVQGVRLSNVVARIAEFGRNATLDVRGQADGALADMALYVNASPIVGWIGGVTKQAEATGNAKLDLRLNIPLLHAADSKVSGALHFVNNDVALADAPPLSRVNGTLNFTEAGVNSSALNATMLGGATKIDAITRADGAMVFNAAGIATVAGLKRVVSVPPVQQLLDRSQGQARYSASVTVRPSLELKIDSDLVGVAIDGIAPLRKSAAEAMPLRIERTAGVVEQGGAERDELRLTAGRALAVRLERRLERGEFRITRGVIALNEAANLPESGLLVLATVARLDLEAWSAFLGGSSNGEIMVPRAATPSSSAEAQIDLLAVRTQELVLMGRTFRNVTLGATRAAEGGFNANVVSDGVSGYIAWRPEQITARLSRLSIPAARKGEVIEALQSPPSALPALDIAAEQFELADLRLGRLDLLAQNSGAGSGSTWRVRRFDITNADLKLTASGEWAPPATGGAARRMKMNFKLDALNAGAALDRLGFSGAMAAGSGALEGDVEWLGSPLDIDYPTLSGKLALSLDNGRFLKIDTGNAGRLLSLLSLQSLSRNLFDGGRRFSEGFAYSTIRADATVARGILATDNFRMTGATAAALLSGTIDLRNETQQLHLVVLPEIDGSAAALALGVANPILGLGAFVASYVLRNPLSKAFALDYDITGTWARPTITRRSRALSNTDDTAR
ncbi:MAG: TIGR02099 family protein [Burkholderiaceae bacterium]|nr:TIGR02099 family protein [Burkholderiaceae bacterium]